MSKELTTEQREALESYAARHGRTWKSKLNTAWMSSSAGPTLQQVRNTFGPSWLISFKLEKTTDKGCGEYGPTGERCISHADHGYHVSDDGRSWYNDEDGRIYSHVGGV